jgi:hypothetical protein
LPLLRKNNKTVYFKVSKPSTFLCKEPNLMIYDNLGNPFYWHTNTTRSITFNLPKGNYSTDNHIRKKLKFIPYGHEKYPIFTNTTFLKNLKIYCRPNPNKASISLERGVIVVDPKYYKSKYKPLKTFTLCHEVFHYFFHCKNNRERQNRLIHQHYEKACDNAAKAWMLANGWNPTQISLAIQMLLKGKERKDCMRDMTTHPKNNFRR